MRRLALVLLLLFAAGCDALEAPAPPTTHVAYVASGSVGTTRLLVRGPSDAPPRTLSLDGVREGVRRMRVAGPAGGDSVVVLPIPTDATVFGMGTVRWSPDGARLAAVVNSGPDQSEVVVFEADGTGGRTASPETQYVANLAWSPDGTRIAYAMTTASPSVLGLFVTDLRTFAVTPVAAAVPVDAISELAWDARGTGLYVAATVGGDGVRQAVHHVTLATGAVRAVGPAVDGFVQDVEAGGGRMLVVRLPEAGGVRGLYEVSTADADAEPLLADLPVAYARYATGGGGRVVLVLAGPEENVRGYRLDVATGARTALPGLDRWASADLFVEE